MLFCETMPFTREMRYRSADGELIAVSYIDIFSSAYSSLYFFHHPDWQKRGLGIFSILKEIEHAHSLGIDHYHLGYYIQGCQSMNYKLRFAPYSLLKGSQRVWEWNDAIWS